MLIWRLSSFSGLGSSRNVETVYDIIRNDIVIIFVHMFF